MSILSKLIAVLFLAFILQACQQESANNNDNKNEVVASQSISQVQGKILGFRDNYIRLEGQDPIFVSDDPDAVTAILLRPAETEANGNNLSLYGRVRADSLSKVFVLSGIEHIYCESNASMQTGMMTSKSNFCNYGLMKDDGTDQGAKFLLKNFKGKKIMVIGNPAMMTNMLGHFAGYGKHVMPEDEYDHVFIVRAKGLGDAEVYHYKY